MSEKLTYLIASIDGLKDSYYVKGFLQNESIVLDIEDAKMIYLGTKEFKTCTAVHSPKRIEFFLSSYQTKINKDIYKINIDRLLGIIAHNSEIKFIEPSISNILKSSVKEQEQRLVTWYSDNDIGITHDWIDIMEEFRKLDSSWLRFFNLAEDKFNNSIPIFPNKKNFYREGISSLIFGKFDKNSYEEAKELSYNLFDNFCYNLADASINGRIKFKANCPFRCGTKAICGISFINEDSYHFDDLHPRAIYRKVDHIYGECSRCGCFKINFSKNENKEITELDGVFIFGSLYSCILMDLSKQQYYWHFKRLFRASYYKWL